MKTTFTLLFLLLASSLFAQEYLKNYGQIKDKSGEVMQLFTEKEYEKAIESLRPYWPLPGNEIDNLISVTIKNLNSVESRFGKTLDYEFIKDQKINELALKQTFVMHMENMLIKFEFIYLKNDKGWIVNGFSWDDDFEELFE